MTFKTYAVELIKPTLRGRLITLLGEQMDVISLEEFKAKHPAGVPIIISFRSAETRDDEGNPKVVTIHVRVENGDALGILDAVIEMGGVGEETPDGEYVFIPWPCALVEIKSAE